MTNEERAAVRTAFRPFMEALAGRSGSVSPEEWAAAVDRIFPSESAIAREVYALAEDTSQRFGDLAMEKNTPEGNYARGAIGEAKSIARAINAIMPIAVESTKPEDRDLRAEFLNRLRSLHNIDGDQLPELEGYDWISFRDDPPRYFMRCNDTQAAAIWREVERRQRRTA